MSCRNFSLYHGHYHWTYSDITLLNIAIHANVLTYRCKFSVCNWCDWTRRITRRIINIKIFIKFSTNSISTILEITNHSNADHVVSILMHLYWLDSIRNANPSIYRNISPYVCCKEWILLIESDCLLFGSFHYKTWANHVPATIRFHWSSSNFSYKLWWIRVWCLCLICSMFNIWC